MHIFMILHAFYELAWFSWFSWFSWFCKNWKITKIRGFFENRAVFRIFEPKNGNKKNRSEIDHFSRGFQKVWGVGRRKTRILYVVWGPSKHVQTKRFFSLVKRFSKTEKPQPPVPQKSRFSQFLAILVPRDPFLEPKFWNPIPFLQTHENHEKWCKIMIFMHFVHFHENDENMQNHEIYENHENRKNHGNA